MYEVPNDTAAQVILAIESGDSIRRVAQHLHTPYETVRQAVNRLEDAGYICVGRHRARCCIGEYTHRP